MKTRYLIALLLLVPLADSLVLVLLAGFVFDWKIIVALVVLTGLVGLLLVRAEGRHTLGKLERKAARGELPTDELLDGGLLIAAGAFLLTPGLVTDGLGFVLALPVTRYPIRAGLKRYVVTPYLDRKTGGFATGKIWTAGFPQGDASDAGSDDTYDVDRGSYRFDDEG